MKRTDGGQLLNQSQSNMFADWHDAFGKLFNGMPIQNPPDQRDFVNWAEHGSEITGLISE